MQELIQVCGFLCSYNCMFILLQMENLCAYVLSAKVFINFSIYFDTYKSVGMHVYITVRSKHDKIAFLRTLELYNIFFYSSDFEYFLLAKYTAD